MNILWNVNSSSNLNNRIHLFLLVYLVAFVWKSLLAKYLFKINNLPCKGYLTHKHQQFMMNKFTHTQKMFWWKEHKIIKFNCIVLKYWILEKNKFFHKNKVNRRGWRCRWWDDRSPPFVINRHTVWKTRNLFKHGKKLLKSQIKKNQNVYTSAMEKKQRK